MTQHQQNGEHGAKRNHGQASLQCLLYSIKRMVNWIKMRILCLQQSSSFSCASTHCSSKWNYRLFELKMLGDSENRALYFNIPWTCTRLKYKGAYILTDDAQFLGFVPRYCIIHAHRRMLSMNLPRPDSRWSQSLLEVVGCSGIGLPTPCSMIC